MPRSLDIEIPSDLVAYLRETRRIEAQETPECRTLSGGVSNRTVWVRRPSGETWVLKQALTQLRVKDDWFADPARVEREAQGLHWLAQLAPPGSTPELLFLDPAHHVLAMRAVPEPHANWKTQLLAGQVVPDEVRQFGQLLGTIHCHSAERRSEVEPVFADRRFFESLRVEPYYRFTAARQEEARAFYATLIEATEAERVALVHGDYSPKNVLVHAGQLVLLDHEVIHWGDPAFDLGFALTHLLAKANHRPERRVLFREAAEGFWRAYSATGAATVFGRHFERRVVAHTLGCLLARVDGRSPLEYLDEPARQRQRQAALEQMVSPPTHIDTLIAALHARREENQPTH